MRNVTVAWDGRVMVFPLHPDDKRPVDRVIEDFMSYVQVFVDEDYNEPAPQEDERVVGVTVDDDGFIRGITKCEACGDVSTSPPDLVCGRVEYSETGFPVTDPCTGSYRRITPAAL